MMKFATQFIRGLRQVTAIEWVVVISIILIVASMVLTAMNGGRTALFQKQSTAEQSEHLDVTTINGHDYVHSPSACRKCRKEPE